MNLALADARTEIDAQEEAARLAAARRDALQALIADLRSRNAEAQDQLALSESQRAELADNLNTAQQALSTSQDALSTTQEALSAEEAARLAEAAAAEALRERLANADTELTAMTLALEEQRKRAEDTLTLLAAARTTQEELDNALADALLRIEAAEAEAVIAENARAELARMRASLDTTQTDLTTTRSELDTARAQLATTQTDLDASRSGLAAAQAELAQLETDIAFAKEQIAASQAQLAIAQEQAATAEAETAEAVSRLNATEEDLLARLALAISDANVARNQIADLEDRLAVSERARVTAEAQLEQSGVDVENARSQLAAALAARLRAEEEAGAQASLLDVARADLSEEQQKSLAAQQQTELLNQQVAALRQQLSELQGLLNMAEEADAAKQVQLQSLGSDLNTALARVAVAERRQRELEEAERLRLEEEARRLAEEQRRLASENQDLSTQAQDLERYRSEFFGRLRDVLGNQEGVRIEGDRFVFSSEVLFAPGEAALSSAGQSEIAKVARILSSVASDIPDELNWVIRVDGHTDNLPLSGLGQYADNWELSQARALSVVRYMIDSLGLPPERLAANGFGQYQPVNSADTPAARAQNRRIELKLTEK